MGRCGTSRWLLRGTFLPAVTWHRAASCVTEAPGLAWRCLSICATRPVIEAAGLDESMYVTRTPTSLAFTRKCCRSALRALLLGTRSTNDRFRSRRGFPCSTVGDLELCSRKGHRLSRVTCRASAKPASRTVRGGPDPCWRLRVGWMPHAACAPQFALWRAANLRRVMYNKERERGLARRASP